MQLQRLVLVAVLVLCASLVHAAEEIFVQDVDNNEVLPENDVRRARVNEVPASTATAPTTLPPATSTTPDTATPPPSSAQPSTPPPPTTEGLPSSTSPKDEPAPPTAAPTRPPSTLSRFLSDIIQIPIAVLRSVGSLLSNTFSGHRSSSSSSTTDTPAA